MPRYRTEHDLTPGSREWYAARLYGVPQGDPEAVGAANRNALIELAGMAPGTGEVLSARDAWNSFNEGNEKLGSLDILGARTAYGDALLSTFGAIPGASYIARGTKSGAAWMDRNVPKLVNAFLDRLAPKDPKKQQIVRVRGSKNTGETASELASKTKSLYNPPVKPERPFSADYPSGGPVDGAGRLLADIEGRPLTATHVAGRRVHGAADEGISPESYGPILSGNGRAQIAPTPPGELRGDAGRYRKTVNPQTGQPEYQISIASDLTDAQAARVTGHELSHHIDEIAGQIPISGLSKELAVVYDTLLTGREKTRNLTGPGHIGYSKDAAPREMIAEAIRAYMTDPNYLKTVAPKTAAAIRAAVNANPRLSKIIQFNALAGALGLGAIGAGAAGEE